MKLPKVRFGLIITLVICASIILFREQATAGLIRLVMLVRGQECYCPIRNAINSLSVSKQQTERSEELSRTAKLVAKDPEGFDLYRVGSQQIWMPAGTAPGWILYDVAEQEREIYNLQGLGPDLEISSWTPAQTSACIPVMR